MPSKGDGTVEVAFASKKLERCFKESKEAERKFGREVARKFILRVNLIKSVRTFDELRRLPGLSCHQLKGHWKGRWAITLVGRFRLSFMVEGESQNTIRVLEVSNHYGD